jgi:hypothetical protein
MLNEKLNEKACADLSFFEIGKRSPFLSPSWG